MSALSDFKGRIVFHAVPAAGEQFTLAIVEENQEGYRPYQRLYFTTLESAQQSARQMNERLGISEKDAIMIVASSMRAQNQGRRRKRG